MDRRQLNIIKDIARQAREWADENAKGHFSSDLCEFCGIASVNLFLLLKKYGFSPKIAVSHCHAFVICDDYIVDVTASQFGEPDICVLKLHKVCEDYWDVEETFQNVDDFMKEQVAWPKLQRAIHYKKKFMVPM